MRVCADPLIRYQLLKFCMNTRLSFLSRNVIPDNMATDCDDRAHIGPAHVDNKIVHEVLRTTTGDTLMHAHTRTLCYTPTNRETSQIFTNTHTDARS